MNSVFSCEKVRLREDAKLESEWTRLEMVDWLDSYELDATVSEKSSMYEMSNASVIAV